MSSWAWQPLITVAAPVFTETSEASIVFVATATDTLILGPVNEEPSTTFSLAATDADTQTQAESLSVTGILVSTATEVLSISETPSVTEILVADATRAESVVQEITAVISPEATDFLGGQIFTEDLTISLSVVPDAVLSHFVEGEVNDQLIGRDDDILTKILSPADVDVHIASESPSQTIVLDATAVDTTAGVISETVSATFSLAMQAVDAGVSVEMLDATAVFVMTETDAATLIDTQTIDFALIPTESEGITRVENVSETIILIPTSQDNRGPVETLSISIDFPLTEADTAVLDDDPTPSVVFDATSTEFVTSVFNETPAGTVVFATTATEQATLPETGSATVVFDLTETDAATNRDSVAVTAVVTSVSPEGIIRSDAPTVTFQKFPIVLQAPTAFADDRTVQFSLVTTEANTLQAVESNVLTGILTPVLIDAAAVFSTAATTLIIAGTATETTQREDEEILTETVSFVATEDERLVLGEGPTATATQVATSADLATLVDLPSVDAITTPIGADAAVGADSIQSALTLVARLDEENFIKFVGGIEIIVGKRSRLSTVAGRVISKVFGRNFKSTPGGRGL